MDLIWKHCLVLLFSTIVTASWGDYIGCFDYLGQNITYQELGLMKRHIVFGNNGHSCIEQCYPYSTYAGTEGMYCSCFPLLIGDKVDDEECDTPCPNQQDQNYTVCGGASRMSVYEIHPLVSIGTFVVVCLLTIVNLLVLRKRRSHTGRSEGGKEEHVYLRPVFATTSPDCSAIPTDTGAARGHVYECVN